MMPPRRILICDDEMHMTDFLEKACIGLGHSVRVLNDPRMFASELPEFDPTDIILDMVMPEIDGFELISCVADAGFRGRLVIISGFNPHYGNMARRLSEAKGLAGVAYLQKPFRISQLRSVLGEKGSSSVLLIEDSPGDVRLMQESFRDANRAIHLHVVPDGVEAMAFLRREGIHAHAPRPDLILLDLNLPKMDGREVLAHIKADEGLKTIPTVILTTSEAAADILKSYQLRANCYLNKPVQLDAFESLVKSINDFWLTEVRLPQRTQSG